MTFFCIMIASVNNLSYICGNLNNIAMLTNNIFAGKGVKTTFVNLLYNELMKREYVTLADVMCLKRRYPKGYYNHNTKATLSREKYYNDLKKASSDLIKALQQSYPGCIEDNGKTGKGKAIRYIGKDNDPLAEEGRAIVQKSVEDYVTFCKNTAGLLPPSWFSAFFENTQLLLEANRDAKEGTAHISSSMEQNLTNIQLLPVFNKAITSRQVLGFCYQPSVKILLNSSFIPSLSRNTMDDGLSSVMLTVSHTKHTMFHWIESLAKSQKSTTWNTYQPPRVSISDTLVIL